jgi:hypothetical protein
MIGWPGLGQVQEYWIDAWQRSILTLDVLRERADIFEQQAEKEVHAICRRSQPRAQRSGSSSKRTTQ